MKHKWIDAGNTQVCSWYKCTCCGKLVSIVKYITEAKDEECPGGSDL